MNRHIADLTQMVHGCHTFTMDAGQGDIILCVKGLEDAFIPTLKLAVKNQEYACTILLWKDTSEYGRAFMLCNYSERRGRY